MKQTREQLLHVFFCIFARGFLGFLAALFFLHFIHIAAVGESSAIEGKLDLISFFMSTPERQMEALGILLSFSLFGIVLGLAGILRQRIGNKEKEVKILEEVSQAKTDFISLASHQLRTPLTAMKWSLKMMTEGEFGRLNPEQNKILLQDIESNDRLIVLVRDLLDISRIEQRRFEIHLKSISLSEAKKIIGKIVGGLKKEAEKKKISLSFIVTSLAENQIFVDPDKLIQIIQNLLENAINYTLSGGEIKVKAETKNNNLLIQIIDSGIGIPETEQRKIFTRFFRAKNARMARSGGTGLGLYLCKTLVEMQDGKIWFTSKENKGTTFTFSLPLRGRAPAEEFLRRL